MMGDTAGSINLTRLNSIKNLSDNADILNRADQERLRKKLNEIGKNDLSENVRETATRELETLARRVGGEFLVGAKIEFKINLANCHAMRYARPL